MRSIVIGNSNKIANSTISNGNVTKPVEKANNMSGVLKNIVVSVVSAVLAALALAFFGLQG